MQHEILTNTFKIKRKEARDKFAKVI